MPALSRLHQEQQWLKLDCLHILPVLVDVQVAPHAVDVLAALVEGRPGERGVVRSCAEALCASGIAQPLLKIAAEMPHQPAGVKVTPEA